MKMVQSCFDFILMLMVQLRFILETRGTLKYSKGTMDQDNFLLDKKNVSFKTFLMKIRNKINKSKI